MFHWEAVDASGRTDLWHILSLWPIPTAHPGQVCCSHKVSIPWLWICGAACNLWTTCRWAIFSGPLCRASLPPLVRPLRSPVLADFGATVGSYRPPMPCGHCAVQILRSARPVSVFCKYILPASPTADYKACLYSFLAERLPPTVCLSQL